MMNFFRRNRRERREQEQAAEAAGMDPRETAPGVRVIKALWDIPPKKPAERVEGEIVTDIYATSRPNGVPRRRNPRHRPRPDENGEFTPPY